MELLVVISIIVILLAILVPSLSKAIKYSEKAKCAANQRNIAQVIVGYTLNNKNKCFPTTGKDPAGQPTFAWAMDYKNCKPVAAGTGPQQPIASRPLNLPLVYASTGGSASAGGDLGAANRNALGLGILVAIGALPTTKLGEIAHCPSLNTNSAAPSPKFGMDEVYSATAGDGSTSQAAGCSYYADGNQQTSRIVGSYNFRGASWAWCTENGATGKAVIEYGDLGAGFTLLMDFPDTRYGAKYCHKDGYNVSYGDGHTEYFSDPIGVIAGKVPPEKTGLVISGNNVNQTIQGKPIDGKTNPDIDEAIYKYVATRSKSN